MAIANGNGNGNGNGASSNGHATQRVLRAGVWAPSPAFFNEDEELGECAKEGRTRGCGGGGLHA